MTVPHNKNSGAYFKVAAGNVPAAVAAGTRNSAAIDRLGYQSCKLATQTGATSGTPTSFTVNAKVQDSADGSTGWADYVPPRGVAADAAITALAAASAVGTKDIDLSSAKRYVRVVEVTAFVGGTAPTVGCVSELVLGGADFLPAV